MITKKDRQLLIHDMKEVFATKDDLKPLKTNLKQVEKKVDGLENRFDTLDRKVDETKKAVKDLTDFVEPAIGNIFKWTDEIHNAFVGKKPPKQPSEN